MTDDRALSRRELMRRAALSGMAAGLATVGFSGEAAAAPGADADAPSPGAADDGARESVAHLADTMIGVPFEKRDVVRIAIVGTGLRGRSVLGEWLGVDGVRIA
ncbi:MAG: gfo/Idh/MocA family oxidoreductase, partial [Gemmatimonadaceae bacterium]